MLTLSGNERQPEDVDPGQLRAVLAGLDQAKCRAFASDEEIEAAFRRFER
jgi:hypothetical protein